MSLPAALERGLAARFGPVEVYGPAGGGSVSQAWRVRAGDRDYCLKHRAEGGSDLFRAEAAGLEALAAAADGQLGIPEVAGWGGGDGTPAWIMTAWVGDGRRADPEALGRGLATLHNPVEDGWGWDEDNFIGPLVQENAAASDWPAFWRGRRLEPQLRQATDRGLAPGPRDDWRRLFSRLPELLEPAERDGPSLLHGDLWSGNVLAGAGAKPHLIDPAVYRGHREVDLAMMQLFGGFAEATFDAYREARPLEPGFEARLPVYQLFYLLVHVNIFGAGYVGRTEAALGQALAA